MGSIMKSMWKSFKNWENRMAFDKTCVFSVRDSGGGIYPACKTIHLPDKGATKIEKLLYDLGICDSCFDKLKMCLGIEHNLIH